MIYLDHAATSFPKPQAVLREVTECLSECGNPGRSGHILASKSEERIYRCREEVCRLVGYDKTENVVFTKNATEAINLALEIYTPPGCHVLISDMDHNATLRPVHRMAHAGRISGYDVFSTSAVTETELDKKKKTDTKMLVCAHAGNVTGHVLPIERIARWCEKNGVRLIVDGSQALGHVDVSVKEFRFCAYCGTSHKALLGIQGCGFAVCGEKSEGVFIAGGTGSFSLLADMPEMLPDRLEAGTLPTPAIASLGAGIRFLRENGDATEKTRALTRYCHDRLAQIGGIRLYSDRNNPCGIVSFLRGAEASETTADRLSQKGVCCRGGLQCAALAHRTLETTETGLVRCSLGYRNNGRDVDRLCEILRSFNDEER